VIGSKHPMTVTRDGHPSDATVATIVNETYYVAMLTRRRDGENLRRELESSPGEKKINT